MSGFRTHFRSFAGTAISRKSALLQVLSVCGNWSTCFSTYNTAGRREIIVDEIFRLRQQKSRAEADTRSREETQKCIDELQDFIREQKTDITEFDKSIVRKPIGQITIYNDHFTVRFKSGLEVDINRYDL